MKVTPVKIKKRDAETGPKTAGGSLAPLWAAVEDWDCIHSLGYRRLSECPEVVSAVDRIAELGGLMTIHLMENSGSGDVRIRDALAQKIDVAPWSGGTRMTFVQWIIQTLFLAGDGNAFVLPVTRDGLLDDLVPVPAAYASAVPEGEGYAVYINGVRHDPDALLHFRLRPDLFYPWEGTGYRLQLGAVLKTLAQARATEDGFMATKWKPSVIIKVDSSVEELSSPRKRSKFLADYVATEEAGQPWLIPGELLDVHEVRPLSLKDLAVSETVELDKRTVAALLGIPPFLLGVGEYRPEAYNNFITTRLLTVMTGIQQEMTKKLLISPARYFRFNPRSLYAYSLRDLAEVGDAQYVRGLMTGNEVRDWIGLPPRDGLDELVMLENYIPADMLGNQKKLIQEGESENGT